MLFIKDKKPIAKKYKIRFHPGKIVCLTNFHFHLRLQTSYFCSLVIFCQFKPYILSHIFLADFHCVLLPFFFKMDENGNTFLYILFIYLSTQLYQARETGYSSDEGEENSCN